MTIPVLTMHSKKRFIPLIIIILAAAAGAYWWSYLRPPEDVNTVFASGTIEAKTVKISSQVPGKILEVLAGEGQKVTKDQELAKIETTSYQNQVEQAKAEVATTAENLKKIEAGAEAIDIDVYEVIAENARIALEDAKASQTDVTASYDKDVAAAQVTVKNTLDTRNFTLQERAEAVADYEELVKKYEHPVYHIPNYTVSQEAEVDAAKATADASYSAFLTAENAYKAALEAKGQVEAKAEQAKETAATAVNSADGNYKKAIAQLRQARKPARDEDVNIAINSMTAAQKRLDNILDTLGKTTVKSPIDGVILTRAVEAGELAGVGSPIFEVADLNKVELAIFIPEAKLGLIKLGQNALISVDSYPKRTWTGAITKISDEAEFTPTNVQTKEQRVTTVFEVIITIENPDQALKPGMPADAKIKLADQN